MSTPIRFIIALFGNRHVGMLLPLLHSIEQSNPSATISLYWEDIDTLIISDFQRAFSQLECIQTHFNFSNDVTKRVSSKTLVWEQAAREKQNESDWLLFLDADMLVIREVGSLLNNFESDGIFTEREGRFPINSGVIAVRASKKTADFFSAWLQKTTEILQTPELYAQANNKNLAYGGADQMALHLLLHYTGYDPKHGVYDIALPNETFHLAPVECAHLNETYSVPITEHTRIIHYKGGWRSILFENSTFTKNRPKKESWEMFILYIQYFKEAVRQLNSQIGTAYTMKDFGFSIPFYLNPASLNERAGFYMLFFVQSWILALPKRIRTFVQERILP